MVKRVAAMILWFVAVWLAYGLVAYFASWPGEVGGVLAALIAAFVFLDPTGAVWGPRGARPAPGTRISAPFKGGISAS